MASISLSVSTAHGSTIDVSDLEREGDCLSIHLRELGISGGSRIVFNKDWVTIHGSIADIRLLAERMLAALPKPEAPAEAFRAVLEEVL